MTKPSYEERRIAKQSESPQIADSASGNKSSTAATETRDQKLVDAMIEGEANRVLENIAVQESRPETIFWLSFADDDGFRGAVLVHANEFLEAVMQANLRGINPHGECQGLECPPERARLIPEEWKNRLLSREDCEKFDEAMTAIDEAAEN